MAPSIVSPDDLESQYETLFEALDALEQRIQETLERIPDGVKPLASEMTVP